MPIGSPGLRFKMPRKPQKGTHPPTCQCKRNPKEATTHQPVQPAGRPPEGPPFFSTDPPVHLLYPRPTHQPTFFLVFFIIRFWAFLGKGSSKTPRTYFCKKSMSKNFPKKIDKNFDVRFSSAFSFYRVFGFFSAMGVQKHYKKRFAKIVSKSFYKKPQIKKSKPIFSRFFSSRFWAFLGEGSSKSPQKISKKNPALILF
jgi:hypothetical protein